MSFDSLSVRTPLSSSQSNSFNVVEPSLSSSAASSRQSSSLLRFAAPVRHSFVLLGLVLIVLSGNGWAQDPCVGTHDAAKYAWDGPYIPIIPATAFDCQSQAPFAVQCKIRLDTCSTVPECTRCKKNPAVPNTGGQPIDFSTGDVYIDQTDLRIPGLGGGLIFERTWNSIWPEKETGSRIGLFGPNWRSTYEERISVGSDGYVKYSRADGSFWSLGVSTTAPNPPDGTPMFSVVSPKSQVATLNQGSDKWTLAFQNGEQRTFDPLTGFLLSITDRNGNVTQLSYDSAFRLVGAVDAASRHLSFSYASPNAYLITGVTSDAGISLSYSYDEQGRLVQVTKPDSTKISFQYDDNSLITAVLDSNNKVLESHTYGSGGKGLTSSRAGGVEAISVSYPQPASPPVTQ
jgi:YD repeat-containing protein